MIDPGVLTERGLSVCLRGLLQLQWERLARQDEKLMRSLHAAAELRCNPEELHVLSSIVALRKELAADTHQVVMEDYGTGKTGRRVSISTIHRTSAIPHPWGLFLFRLVREWKPRRVLELGTNLGVSSCYMCAALDLNANEGRFLTIEGDPTLASVARKNIGRISDSPVDVVQGRFQDVLPEALDVLGSVDLVFIDGHHDEEPTYSYFQTIRPYLTGDGIAVFDDVYPLSPVRRAWKRIVNQTAAFAADLIKIGIVRPLQKFTDL